MHHEGNYFKRTARMALLEWHVDSATQAVPFPGDREEEGGATTSAARVGRCEDVSFRRNAHRLPCSHGEVRILVEPPGFFRMS